MLNLWSFVVGATVGVLVTLSVVDEKSVEFITDNLPKSDD